MKFRDIKPIIKMEFLDIYISGKSYNLLRKENWQISDPDGTTEFDDFEVASISGKGDCSLFVYLKNE